MAAAMVVVDHRAVEDHVDVDDGRGPEPMKRSRVRVRTGWQELGGRVVGRCQHDGVGIEAPFSVVTPVTLPASVRIWITLARFRTSPPRRSISRAAGVTCRSASGTRDQPMSAALEEVRRPVLNTLAANTSETSRARRFVVGRVMRSHSRSTACSPCP